jgi:hypothetical protein
MTIAPAPETQELAERNRRVAKALVTFAAVLAVAALLAGVRW